MGWSTSSPILVDTLLATWLPAWKLKRAVKQVAHPKLFLFDTGVARQLAGTAHLPMHPEERGPLLETWLLHVTKAGVIEWIDNGPTAASRTSRVTVTATTQAGPLVCNTGFRIEGRRPSEWSIEDLVWNPPVPKGLAEANDPLLGGK